MHIIEPELDEVVKKVVQEGLLIAHSQAKPGDVYLIVVPTPFKENNEPDISYIKSLSDWEPKVTLSEGLNTTIQYFDKILNNMESK